MSSEPNWGDEGGVLVLFKKCTGRLQTSYDLWSGDPPSNSLTLSGGLWIVKFTIMLLIRDEPDRVPTCSSNCTKLQADKKVKNI